MRHGREETVALNVCDAGAVPQYEAVVVARAAAGRRKAAAAGVAILALALTATVLLGAERYAVPAGPPSVADAVASLRIGEPAGAVSGAQELGAATPEVNIFKVSPPGTLPPPPPGNPPEYNIFDPHYSKDGVPKSVSGGTPKGSFTGHSGPSAVGGPLTFGPNTYWNVFDPNGSPDMGPCDPGSTGQAGTATQKRDCRECTAGHWCPGGQDSLEHDCPDHATSFPGAFAAKQCTCSPGWYGIPEYGSGKSCQMCLSNTYCPGGRKQFACPQFSSSPDEASYCTCNPGYFGVTHDLCQLCEENNYCPGGDPRGQQQYACTLNSISPAGSDSGRDCNCKAGFFEPVPSATPEAGPDCVMCPEKTYCPGGKSNVQCPANSHSPPGSTSSTDCVCNAGYFGNARSGCTRCPAGMFCPGGETKTQCPANSYSNRGSVKLADCTCNAGFMGRSDTACTICPAGSYCPGGGAVYTCTQYAHSSAGSSKCNCNAGYVRKSDGTCFQCPANHFCPAGRGDYEPQQCPPNTVAKKGSLTAHDCKCKSGFENVAYGNSQLKNSYWRVVPSGSWNQVNQRCKNEGGELASINNALEATVAGSMCSTCWIGLRQAGRGRAWKWTDGHSLDYTTWDLGQPQNNNEHWVRYHWNGAGWVWHDYPQNHRFHGICKLPAPPQCQAMASPKSVGMQTGFLTDFYYVGQTIHHFPDWKVAQSEPNSEKVQDGIEYPHDHDFRKVDPHIPHDRIAGTFTGMLPIYKAGTYYFYTTSDDGSHLWIDGVHVVSNGGLHGRRQASGSISLQPGYHMIYAKWFENGGGANMVARYHGPDTGNQWIMIPAMHFIRARGGGLPNPAAMNMKKGWMCRIFLIYRQLHHMPNVANRHPDKQITLSRVELNDGGWGSKAGAHDQFAAVLTGVLPVYEQGWYSFWTTSDDGSQLYVNGVHVVNNGGLHGARKHGGTIRLARGYHFMKVDFFENHGGAYLQVTYRGPDTGNHERHVEAYKPPGAP